MTTMNNHNESTTITFRSKFEKLLSDENRPAIEAAFEKFCNIDPETTVARDILWDLTYNPEVSFEALQKLGLNQEIISPENVSKLRDELRHQYEKLHNGYLTVDVSDECIPAFEALSKKASPITASMVNELCSYRLHGRDVPRALFLLKSDKENFFFGGICDIGFNTKEAEYLKPFHMEIHNLLKAMYDCQQDASKNTPLDKLGSMVKEAGIELPFDMGKDPKEASNEAQAEQPVEADFGFRPLTPEGILEHKDVFTAFIESCDMNLLLQIGRFGFDLNKVISKKEAISKVLEVDAKRREVDQLLQQVATLNRVVSTLMFEATEALNN